MKMYRYILNKNYFIPNYDLCITSLRLLSLSIKIYVKNNMYYTTL